MEFRILGPLEVASDRRLLPLGGAKQRALLAHLLLHPNGIVTTERLVDDLWGEDPPRRATKALQMHVLGLRRVLEEGRLETQGHGYRLRIDPGELDLERWCEQIAEQAGVLLLPGTVYEQPQHVRFGFGRANLPQAIARLDHYLG